MLVDVCDRIGIRLRVSDMSGHLPPTEKFWLSSADVDLSSVLDVLDEVAIIIGLDTVITGTLHFVNASVRYI